MVRRFYSSTHNPDNMSRDRVTGVRIRGEWVINTIKETKRTVNGRWDVPGEYLGSVVKRGSKWIVQWKHDHGNLHAFPTLTASVDYLMERNR